MRYNLKYTLGGKVKRADVVIEQEGDRLLFPSMEPFNFKDEIKAMHGYKFDWDEKLWSASNSYRNNFQLQAMMGHPVYEPWQKPIVEHEFTRSLYDNQVEMANFALTRRYVNLAVDMGLGKTLSMIEAMELSGITDWWWVAPKSGMKSLVRELKKWGLADHIKLRRFEYDPLREFVKKWGKDKVFPQGIIFDESSRLANPSTGWTVAAQAIADNMRFKYGWDGMVVTMSGTTNSESISHIWSQIEVTWPGYLREGSRSAFEKRLGIFDQREDVTGQFYSKEITLLDDENKCKKCGQFKEDHPTEDDCERWAKSINEVAYVSERLKGIQLVQKKEDCLDLPPKRYRTVEVKPSSSTLRAARAMVASAPSTIVGLNWLRQLADGFGYRPGKGKIVACKACGGTGEREEFTSLTKTTNQVSMQYNSSYISCEKCKGSGTTEKDVRETFRVKCPKDDALRDLLAENYEQGRVCVFAAYHGSIDRCEELCLSEGWDVFHVDGRGWRIKTLQDSNVKVDPLDYWADLSNRRVAFVAHPKSGGMGLTLTEARMAIYYSNPFSAEDRLQSEDRIHRIGCDLNLSVEIVDIVHLDSDRLVKDALRNKKRLEKMTLGQLNFDEAI